MKFNFKKISAIVASTLMTGMTLGVAAAAAYPAPFVSGGSANVAIVYGTGAGVSALDVVQAGNIQSNLQSKMRGSVDPGETISGEAKSLASGSDLVYLLDDLAENVQTITKDDLPTVLADGKFVDDGGTTWEYEQTIAVGTSTINRFSFGNSDNDFDDPALMLELSTSANTPMYTWTVNFDKATPLNATDSEGEEIILFGKTYTIGTATDGDTLILLGGAGSQKVYVGETLPITVNDKTYQVTVDGLSSDATTVVSITIDGQTKTFTQGQTKTYVIGDNEVDVYAKTVFRTGDDGSGYAEIELGSNKLTFESGDAVQYGSDNTDIDGTKVTLTGTAGNVMATLTAMTVAVAAKDSDLNHILVGESFADPVFGTLKLDFTGVTNGPVFEGEEDTGRTALEVKSGGSRELQVMMTDAAGTTKTIPFTYQGQMKDDASNPFITIEGNNLTDDDYFILNSGDYQHVMQVSKINMDTATTSDVEITDQFTGTKYLVENKDFTLGQNVTINSQTYTITNTSSDGAAAGIHITRAGADAASKRAVFPYLELVAGEDFPRVTLINTTNGINDVTGDVITDTSAGTRVTGRTYELPTGTIQFGITNGSTTTGSTNNIWVEYGVTPTGGSITWTNITGSNVTGVNHTSIQVGEGWYIFGTVTSHAATAVGASTVTIKNVTLNSWFNATTGAENAAGGGALTYPALLFVEDKDKSNGDARSAVALLTTDDATYSEISADPAFSNSSYTDSETWDDTKLKGFLTSWGTYILKDTSDTNINLERLTYPSKQMYASVYLAESSATIAAGVGGGSGTLGDVLVKDSEVSSVSTKNLIVVGGSCINSAAATLVGGARCGAAWTDSTGVGSGQFIIKGYDSSSLTSKLALLVAGYDAADTANAATYLRTKAIDTSKAYKGTSATSATLITETA